jgi:hypothetical protein
MLMLRDWDHNPNATSKPAIPITSVSANSTRTLACMNFLYECLLFKSHIQVHDEPTDLRMFPVGFRSHPPNHLSSGVHPPNEAQRAEDLWAAS